MEKFLKLFSFALLAIVATATPTSTSNHVASQDQMGFLRRRELDAFTEEEAREIKEKEAEAVRPEASFADDKGTIHKKEKLLPYTSMGVTGWVAHYSSKMAFVDDSGSIIVAGLGSGSTVTDPSRWEVNYWTMRSFKITDFSSCNPRAQFIDNEGTAYPEKHLIKTTKPWDGKFGWVSYAKADGYLKMALVDEGGNKLFAGAARATETHLEDLKLIQDPTLWDTMWSAQWFMHNYNFKNFKPSSCAEAAAKAKDEVETRIKEEKEKKKKEAAAKAKAEEEAKIKAEKEKKEKEAAAAKAKAEKEAKIKAEKEAAAAKAKAEKEGKDTQTTEGNGDPHFRTWKDEHFEFHGQCDVVMTKVKDFAGLGMDLEIHIRTKMVRYWSYIKTAVIRIGNDILQVEGYATNEDGEDKLHYHMNYEFRGSLEDGIGGFPVTTNPRNNMYTINLDSKFSGQKIRIKTMKEFVGVKIIGATEESFGNAVGITGNFKTGKTVARDGVTVLDDFNELGLEWQVLPSDGNLFSEPADPQFPELCYLPEDPRGERARRLAESEITEEAAEAACAGLKHEFDRKGCIYDILATQDFDMVDAY